MSILYDDKKILASSWLLNYLENNHCYKINTSVLEYNGYRADLIKISDLSHKTKIYNNEILGQAADILALNGHIKFQSKNIRKREDSDIFILEEGRQAVKSSYYKKIIFKKWFKRALIILGAIGSAIIIWVNSKKLYEPKNKTETQYQPRPLSTKKYM